MNLSPRWAAWLTTAGHDAVHWSTVGPPVAPDTEIMAWARTHDRVVLTHDLDFGAILAATDNDKPSVIQIRADDNSPETVGAVVLAALAQAASDLDVGALVTVEPGRSRLRLLPLSRRSIP